MIKIFDNVFSFETQHKIYAFACSSYFRIGWEDNLDRGHSYLHSEYSEDDLATLNIDKELPPIILDEVKGLTRCRAVVNLSTPADSHFIHVHPGKRVLLYYVNPEWNNNGWHGETLFYNDNQTIHSAFSYTPNRVIVFDGNTPHAIRPQSHIAQHYRFTLAMLYDINT